MTRFIDDEKVAALVRQGMSTAQIADKLKYSTRTVQRARERLGLAQPAPSINHLTPEEIDQVEQLLADGCSLREAARTVGRHPDGLYKNRRFTTWRWDRHEVALFVGFCSKMSKAGKFFNPSTGPQE